MNRITMALNRALGCLYGQLIGDSLGCRYEFKPAVMVQKMIAQDRDEHGFLPILSGGPFSMQPGQVTDDSEMALSMASSIARNGKYDPLDVACSYVAWAQSSPPDIGQATHNALSIEKKLPSSWPTTLSASEKKIIYDSVISNVKRSNKGSLSNGCLMRISPLAIYSINHPLERIKEMVRDDCSLTHDAELCYEGVFAYVLAVRDLLLGKSATEAYDSAMQSVSIERLREHLVSAQEKASPVNIGEQYVSGEGKAMGYIGVALQSAFYELLHAKSFEEGLIAAISRGGDTDTNGAIVGAMLGAKFGGDNIPASWKTTVSNAKPRDKLPFIEHDVDTIVKKLLVQAG